MRLRVGFVAALFCCFLLYPRCGYGSGEQSASLRTSVATSGSNTHYPDQGFLSNYRYANAFFGFSVDLPADANFRAIPIPTPADGSIPLLETLGPHPSRAVLSIVAYAPADKRPDARALLRRHLDEELMIGVEELHGLSKTNIAGRQFFFFETRRGIDQHVVYATELDGYVLCILAAARDPRLLQQLQSAVTHMRFFDPASIGDYAGVGAEPYEGPAIPSHVLAELKSDPPARKLDSGNISGSIYDNRELGLGYELPKGWNVSPQGAVMPAVERSREQNFGKPAVGANERILLEACERTLISAWRKTPQGPEGQISYDEFGEVTISATSLACFPNVKFPEGLEGKDPLRDFLVAYGLSHPIMSDVKSARAFKRDGHLFIVMDGVVAYKEPGDALSRRVSFAIALTKQRGYLLNFLFAAPHEADQRELMSAKAAFDPEPAIQEAKSTPTPSTITPPEQPQPGGSGPSNASLTVSAPGASATTSPSPAASNGASLPAGSTQASTTSPQPRAESQGSVPGAESTPARPSLLKPGETMQDQQMKGRPVPGKAPSK